MSTQNQWEITLRSAKSLELRLEATVQKYSSIAQKLSADYLCDEENAGLLESKEEQEIGSIIETDLKKVLFRDLFCFFLNNYIMVATRSNRNSQVLSQLRKCQKQ